MTTLMQYSHLGRCGLPVSQLGLGTWVTFGAQISDEMAEEIVTVAYDSGINVFDTAEVYANGKAEIALGKILKKKMWKRSTYIVTTKIFWGGKAETEKGLSRKHIIEGLRGSLERLQLDYVDIVFANKLDSHTPMEEIVRAFTHCINQNWALYWATSRWSPNEIMEAYTVARTFNLIAPICEQVEYNLFRREKVEYILPEITAKIGIGLITWSPLASGICTGKYRDGIPLFSRASLKGCVWLKEKLLSEEGQRQQAKLSKLQLIADKLSCTLSQLSIAWCLQNEMVHCTLLGVSSAEQLYENLQAFRIVNRLTTGIKQEIETILDGTDVGNLLPNAQTLNIAPTLSFQSKQNSPRSSALMPTMPNDQSMIPLGQLNRNTMARSTLCVTTIASTSSIHQSMSVSPRTLSGNGQEPKRLPLLKISNSETTSTTSPKKQTTTSKALGEKSYSSVEVVDQSILRNNDKLMTKSFVNDGGEILVNQQPLPSLLTEHQQQQFLEQQRQQQHNHLFHQYQHPFQQNYDLSLSSFPSTHEPSVPTTIMTTGISNNISSNPISPITNIPSTLSRSSGGSSNLINPPSTHITSSHTSLSSSSSIPQSSAPPPTKSMFIGSCAVLKPYESFNSRNKIAVRMHAVESDDSLINTASDGTIINTHPTLSNYTASPIAQSTTIMKSFVPITSSSTTSSSSSSSTTLLPAKGGMKSLNDV
ncbi:hypothetical protein SNEBB_008385 [Seison nebaliae]|nr:hypothetical protein SNEBB_008385 [Seison nebaliae]